MSKIIKRELTKDMQANIDNYSSRVETIEDDMKAVRQMPGMYIGPKNEAGLLNMIREVFQNALDQLLDPLSPCTHLSIIYDERNNETSIEDNGSGVPFEDMVRFFTKMHTSKNYNKRQLGDYSSGLHGVGAKATNALSRYFIVESYHYSGKAKRAEFSEGQLKGKIKDIPNKELKQGTKIIFAPDNAIMGDTPLQYIVLYDLVNHILSLTPLGSTVEFTATDFNGKVTHELMVNKDGIITDLILKMTSPIIAPIILSKDTGEMMANVAFSFDSNNLEGENITAYANMCPTSTAAGNTHVKGFLAGVTYWFVDYMNKIYLNGAKSKVKATGNDIKAGLNAMISVAHLHPNFTGQAKEVFSNQDMEGFVKSMVLEGLDTWSKNNPQELQKLCKLFKEIAEIRQKSDGERIKITTKYTSNVLTGLPSKYHKPQNKTGLELIIVEGDSAGGTAKSGRDSNIQGIFPIRGKIPNVFDTPMNKLLANAEIQGIIAIIGCGYGKNFDLEKAKTKWSKIIFMADADPDGAHINSLLLRMFLVFFPGLIEAGLVFRAVPPLYGIRKNKKMIYFTDRIDYIKYMQTAFNQDNVIETVKGEKIPPSKILNVLVQNIDYTYDMDTIANRYAIDPNLIELVLISSMLKESIPKLKKSIQSKYRFMDVKKIGNATVVEGLTGTKYNTLYLNDRFIKDCESVIAYLKVETIFYKLNGIEVSLYTLMKAFEASTPKGFTRYKGLGEQNADQLAESTLLPTSDRMLLKYTTDNIKKDTEMIRMYDSDKRKILAHIDKVTRTDLLD